jgi:hypothetical protein
MVGSWQLVDRCRGGGPADFGGDADPEGVAGSRGEPCGGAGHVQGLVRAGGVVVLAPRINGGLGVGDRGERRMDGQQFVLQGLVIRPWSPGAQAR